MREQFRTIRSSAHEAATRGFWKEGRPIDADVNAHITTLLGVLVGGDGRLTDQEAELFNDVFAEVLGGRQPLPLLRALLKEHSGRGAELTARPPAFFDAILRMDAAGRTDTATRVLSSLQEIGREAAALDGRLPRDELSILTEYIMMLRGRSRAHPSRGAETFSRAADRNARDAAGEAPPAGWTR